MELATEEWYNLEDQRQKSVNGYLVIKWEPKSDFKNSIPLKKFTLYQDTESQAILA